MEFYIGENVRVRKYEDLADEVKHKGLGKHAGRDGVITDVMFSNAKDCFVYRIQFNDADSPSRTDFVEGTFDRIEDLETVTYSYEFEFAENLVIARFYQHNGEEKKMIGRGHGHIFHDGSLGIAQAASYALKRIFNDLEDRHNETN